MPGNAIIGSGIGVMVGVIIFAVVKEFVAGQDTTTWSGSEITIMTVAVPIAIAITVFVAAFAGLSRIRGS